MKRLVVDAPVISSWFPPGGAGRSLRDDYEAGTLSVLGPLQMLHDVVGEVARRTDDDPDRLGRIGVELGRLGFELQEPPVIELARWVSRGLPPHRAAYVALAAALELPLVTSDETLLEAAPAVARPPDAP